MTPSTATRPEPTAASEGGDPRPLAWHARTSQDAFQALNSGATGLSEDEVARRRERYGWNRLAPPQTRGPLRRFTAQFQNLLIYVLVAAMAVTAVLGHWIDAAVILAVVVVNAVLSFIQEGKAERALDAIRHMLSPQAMVLRDGRRISVAAAELVPGDVVLLQSGDKVPADLSLVHVQALLSRDVAKAAPGDLKSVQRA